MASTMATGNLCAAAGRGWRQPNPGRLTLSRMDLSRISPVEGIRQAVLALQASSSDTTPRVSF